MDSRNLYVSFVTQLITCLVLVMGFLSIDHSTAFSQPKDEGLFTASPVVGSLSREGPTVIRKRFVTVNFKLVGGAKGSPPSEVLTLNLFPDTVFTARLERFEKTRSGYAWIGHLEGVGLSDAVLVVVDQVMVGSITMPGASYLVEFAGNGVHAIYELNEAAFPPDGPVPPLPEGTDEKQRQVSTNTALDDGSIIDVMVVYTPAARIAAGGTEAIQATIGLFVAQTNQAYQNSGINPRLRLVHTTEVSYVETGGGEDLGRLQNPSDGYMDNVHHLRNTYRADLVALITEPSTRQYCGIAYLIGTNPAHEAFAFSVTVRSCGGLVFAHELGHNQGAHHDWYVAASPGAYTYSHGHVNVARRWLTIMSYHDKCTHSGVSCNRITHFSNPDIAYDGAPTGVSPGTNLTCTEGNLNNPDCDADNRRTLNNTAYIVANFRTASVVGNDHFINAEAISGSSGTVTGSNVGATKEPGEPNHAGNAGGASVWYSWTPSTSGSATIDTIGSNFDTLLAVYTGSSVGSLTLIASNDDIGGGSLQSRVTFPATAGTTYRIAVDGYDSTTGNITLNWGLEAVNRTLTVAGAGTGTGTVTATGINCTITAGSTSGDCSETVPNGTNITLTSTAASGSTFAGWTNCDAPSGNQCTMTMNANKTCTATFNLTVSCSGVQVSVSPTRTTFRPTTRSPDTRSFSVTVRNNSGGPVTVNAITLRSGTFDGTYTLVRISPTLPQTVLHRRSRTFTVMVRKAANTPAQTVTAPFFDVQLSCGILPASERLIPLRVEGLQVEQHAGQVRVAALGEGIASIGVELFDLSGRRLLTQGGEGRELTVAMNGLANGVYLYVVRVRGFDGREHVSEVRKLVILR